MEPHLSQLIIQRRRRLLQISEEKNDKEPYVSINARNDPTRDATFSVCHEELGFLQ